MYSATFSPPFIHLLSPAKRKISRYNKVQEGNMEQDKKELEVIVCGELDMQKIPKDMFDAFITAVVDNITKSIRKDNACNKKKSNYAEW